MRYGKMEKYASVKQKDAYINYLLHETYFCEMQQFVSNISHINYIIKVYIIEHCAKVCKSYMCNNTLINYVGVRFKYSLEKQRC